MARFCVRIYCHTTLVSVFEIFGKLIFNLICGITFKKQPSRYFLTLRWSYGMQRNGTETKSENEYNFRRHAVLITSTKQLWK